MKIAIIGSGIAGNVAAYHLQKQHEITLFEANDYIGGHTHTHDIEWQGQHYAVDSGFIVYNEKTYPNFIGLLTELGVATQPTEMSFSVKCERTGLEYNGHSLNTLFAQRRNILRPGFYRMISDILRFNREALQLLEQDSNQEITLGEYLQQQGFSEQFKNHYIIPMGAAIWSTDPRLMQQFPARFFLRFFHNHGLLQVADRPQWYVISGGSARYVEKLTASFRDSIQLSSAVESMRRYPDYVEIQPKNQPPQRFDGVFMACHSDETLALLQQPTTTEREVLGAIRYQQNEAVLHTDATILPQRKRAWASWNYHLLNQPDQAVALTYNMNILQGMNAPVEFCVTLNSSDRIDPSKIIERISYSHPLFTPETVVAQQRQAEINGVQRTWFCGAYWRNGFHEDGVVSALQAVEQFQEQMDA